VNGEPILNHRDCLGIMIEQARFEIDYELTLATLRTTAQSLKDSLLSNTKEYGALDERIEQMGSRLERLEGNITGLKVNAFDLQQSREKNSILMRNASRRRSTRLREYEIEEESLISREVVVNDAIHTTETEVTVLDINLGDLIMAQGDLKSAIASTGAALHDHETVLGELEDFDTTALRQRVDEVAPVVEPKQTIDDMIAASAKHSK